ncbi:MAG: hypothetical protein KatS3mg065_0755 [Chloroflexota bacterium]|nr:MAG: hypothetical protein KatS3mg065_0755 [Chloroflexota bacterium]
MGGREGIPAELEPADPEGEEGPVVRSEGEASDVGRRRSVDGDDDASSRLGSSLAAGQGPDDGEGGDEDDQVGAAALMHCVV